MGSDIRNTNLYEILNHLKPSKRQAIIKLSEANLIRSKKKELHLLKELLKHIEKSPFEPFYKKDLIEKTSIPEKKINHLTNALSKKIKRILPALDLFKDYNHENAHLLMLFFLEEGLHKNAQSTLRNMSQSLKEKSNLSLYDFHFYEMKYYETCLLLSGELGKVDTPNLYLMNNSLDSFYVENKLRLLCLEMLKSKSFTKKNNVICNPDLETSLQNLIIEKAFFNSIHIEIFFHIYKMLSNNLESSYNKVLELFTQHRIDLLPKVASEIIKYMMDQCNSFMNSNWEYSKYAADFISFSEELESIEIFPKYPLVLFHNIIFAGASVKSQRWCEAFIKRKVMQLDSSNYFYNEITHLAYVKLSFGHYQEALTLIKQLDSPETLDTIAPKDHILVSLFYYRIFIQLYFKMEVELALKKNDALRKYFDRNKKNIAASNFQKIDNFIKFTRRIITTPKYSNNWTLLKNNISQKKGEIAYTYAINFMLKNKK